MDEKLLQLAKAFENTTITRKDAVSKFGSEGQKNHFEKYGRFKDKRKEEPFLKTLNQLFESVESVKTGNKSNYKLGSARVELADRQDDRLTNGDYKNSTKHLDALILAHLENDIEKHVEIENSIIGWMKEFKMINELSYELYTSKFNNQLKNKVLKDIEFNINANRYLDNVVDASYKFIQTDIKNQRATLISSLRRMQKHGIVETFDRPKAMRIDSKTGVVLNKVDVNMELYKQYTNKKRQLKESLGIDDKQINNYHYEKAEIKKVIDIYNDEIKKFLSDVEIKDFNGKVINVALSHIWLDLAIIVKATRKKVMEYLHKFHAEILKEYIEYKECKYLSTQAKGYKTERTSEKLKTAESIKDKNIEYRKQDDELEQNRWAIGKSRYVPNHFEQQAIKSKIEFLEAIEILDKVYADKFIIDEELLEEKANKRK